MISSWGKRSARLGIDKHRRKRPIWMLALLLFATQGLYAPVWLAVTWHELRRELPTLRLGPILHGFALMPPLFAVGWLAFQDEPEIFWIALNLVGVMPVSWVALLTAAVGYVLLTRLQMTELVLGGRVDVSHYLGVLVVIGCACAITIPGQRRLNEYYDSYPKAIIVARVHPFEWVTVVAALALQVFANQTFI